MSDPNELATKWNVRHRFAAHLAAGRGGNARHLHQLGFTTTAWDLSSTAMNELNAAQPGVKTEVRDVITSPPEPLSFDIIVVSRFLDRSICAAIEAALRPAGLLFYQTFTRGLANPDYLLRPGELPTLFPTLRPLWFEEPIDGDEAMLVAQRGDL